MQYNRRKFLQLGGGLAGGLLLSSLGCGPASKTSGSNNDTGNGRMDTRKQFGIQLYTLRDDLPKDPKGILKQLSSFGYKQIESYEGPMGMFWGMTNREFQTYMTELGMTLVSSHCDYTKDFERKAAEAAAIGMSYLICPWLGPQKSIDDFKRHADSFNKAGAICKKEGIRFAYHNHDYSFVEMEGQLGQDVLITQTDAALVDFEMDHYWVVTAGHSPQRWMQKYPNRFKLCHVKDRMKKIKETDKFASCNLGDGVIDYAPIIKTGMETGMQYLIVEQERYDGTTPIKSAEANAAYMKKQLAAI